MCCLRFMSFRRTQIKSIVVVSCEYFINGSFYQLNKLFSDVLVHYKPPKRNFQKYVISKYLSYFFKIYSETYDPKHHIICPYYGEFLSKER